MKICDIISVLVYERTNVDQYNSIAERYPESLHASGFSPKQIPPKPAVELLNTQCRPSAAAAHLRP